MPVLGIIAEYNPFHNGHLYHLQKAKEKTGADCTIVVMGGNFLQRGEPALWNKWVRTKMALLAGIDLVIELPFVFATQDAHRFAQAGVSILNALGIVDYITFGCENDNMETFSEVAQLVRKEPFHFKKILKSELKKGFNYPKAREKSILSFFQKYRPDLTKKQLDELTHLLRQSNNILALEYIIALQSLNSFLKPLPILRIGSDFSENRWEGEYSSATAIRKLISRYYCSTKKSDLNKIKASLPATTFQIILEELERGINPIFESSLNQSVIAKLRSTSVFDLKEINGIQEGLENLLKKAADAAGNIEELVEMVKSKRYTYTRIKRIILHCLFNLSKKEILVFNKNGPQYGRVLGMSHKGRIMLKKAKLTSRLPLILSMKHFYSNNLRLDNEYILKMLNFDILATDLYVLAYNSTELRLGKQDFSRKIIIV